MQTKLQPVVYIDSENFLFKVADILKHKALIKHKDEITNFDFKYLMKAALPDTNFNIRYYSARAKLIRSPQRLKIKTTKIINNRRTFKTVLLKQGITTVDAGRLKLRDGDLCKACGKQDLHLQEKGVDVCIAVDMITDSQKGRRLYLVSSDTDLLPAINRAQTNKSKVIYVGFSTQPTQVLIKTADAVVILRDIEIIEAFKRANQPKSIA